MNRLWMRCLIPREWTGEQALFVAGVLRGALDAIWFVHGEEMAYSLGDKARESWDEVLGDMRYEDNDDIPF